MELNPVIPFEPMSAEDIPVGEGWISQVKWDGVRILTYFNGEKVDLFNRKLNKRTNHYPELTNISTYCKANSVILDGEVVSLGNDGYPSFHEVMRRDGLRRMERVPQVMQTVPVYYMIFDVIYYNGEWINNYPLYKRLELLSNIIEPNNYIQNVPVQNDGRALFEVIKQHDLEGIICKNINSPYILSGKNLDWRKIKNYKDLIGVIGGVTYRAGVVNSILIGLYDDQNYLRYIGHVGTGKLTRIEWRELTEILEPLKIDDIPFINEPDRLNKVQWIKPIITVKVKYIEWPKGHSLRQPSIQALVDHDPKKCRLNG